MDRFFGQGETPPPTPGGGGGTGGLDSDSVMQGPVMEALFASLEERAGFEQRIEELEIECERLRAQVGLQAGMFGPGGLDE